MRDRAKNRLDERAGGGNRVLRVALRVLLRAGNLALHRVEVEQDRLLDHGRYDRPGR
jgi:hypothetical protein